MNFIKTAVVDFSLVFITIEMGEVTYYIVLLLYFSEP